MKYKYVKAGDYYAWKLSLADKIGDAEIIISDDIPDVFFKGKRGMLPKFPCAKTNRIPLDNARCWECSLEFSQDMCIDRGFCTQGEVEGFNGLPEQKLFCRDFDPTKLLCMKCIGASEENIINLHGA